MINEYTAITDIEDRKRNSKSIMEKYPGKIPIICLVDKKITTEKSYYKFLVDKSITLSMLVATMRKKISIDPYESIFIMTETNELLVHQTPVQVFYSLYHNRDDGFLYIYARKENSFGDIF